MVIHIYKDLHHNVESPIFRPLQSIQLGVFPEQALFSISPIRQRLPEKPTTYQWHRAPSSDTTLAVSLASLIVSHMCSCLSVVLLSFVVTAISTRHPAWSHQSGQPSCSLLILMFVTTLQPLTGTSVYFISSDSLEHVHANSGNTTASHQPLPHLIAATSSPLFGLCRPPSNLHPSDPAVLSRTIPSRVHSHYSYVARHSGSSIISTVSLSSIGFRHIGA